MILQYKEKFLIRPRPFEDEFIINYLERLKEANVYTSIVAICLTVFKERINLSDIIRGKFNKDLFSQYTLIPIKDIEKMCINNNYYISHNIFLCTECFNEIGYIKKDFYRKNYICNKHKLPIISKCIYCDTLFDWKNIDSKRCQKCLNLIHLSGEHILNIDFNIVNLFTVYTEIFNYKNFPPDKSSFYFNVYIRNLIKCNDFINNKNNFLDNFIRRLYFKDSYHNKYIYSEVIDYVFFMIKLERIVKTIKYENILNEICKVMKNFAIMNFNIKVSAYLCRNLDRSYIYTSNDINYEKYFFVSFEICENILKLDKYFIQYLCKKGVLKLHLKKYIDVSSLFDLCYHVKTNSTIEDLSSNYYEFNDLHYKAKIKIIKMLSSRQITLYNFNINYVFSKIKIHKNDLEFVL